jgi:hypothetical protein
MLNSMTVPDIKLTFDGDTCQINVARLCLTDKKLNLQKKKKKHMFRKENNKNAYITSFDVFHARIFFVFYEKRVHMIQHWISIEEKGLLITVYAVFTRIQDNCPSQSSIFIKIPIQKVF